MSLILFSSRVGGREKKSLTGLRPHGLNTVATQNLLPSNRPNSLTRIRQLRLADVAPSKKNVTCSSKKNRFSLPSFFESRCFNCCMSPVTLSSKTFAYNCVVRRFLCPNIFPTVSIGTPLVNVTVGLKSNNLRHNSFF
jgi:hypothetical protein